MVSVTRVPGLYFPLPQGSYGAGERTHNGANHPIRYWQAMESDPHGSGYREDEPITASR
jgi:hypothetical protein